MTEQDIEEIVEDKVSQTQKIDEGGKGAVCWLREREKTERTWGKYRVGTNCENILCRSEEEGIFVLGKGY